MREGINKFDSSALKGPSGTSYIERVDAAWDIVFGNLVKKEANIRSNLEKIERAVFAPKTGGANTKKGVGTILLSMEERITAIEQAIKVQVPKKGGRRRSIAVMLEALEKELQIETKKGSFEERIADINAVIGLQLQGNIADNAYTLYEAMFPPIN